MPDQPEIAQSASLTNVVTLANTVKDSIIAQYQKYGDKFLDIERCRIEGLISQSAGALSLLILANGFPEELELGEAWKTVVLRETRKVFDYVRERGFDATPFMAAEKTDRYGLGKELPYTDSLTWVLSLALHLRLAQQKTRVTLSDDIEKQMRETIRDTLKRICDGMHPDGGWGFTKDCSSPDLYFSYAVAESLADFGDYVLGETPEIAERDEKLIELLLGDEPGLVDRVQSVREKTAAWLIKTHLSTLGEKLIVPTLQPDDFHRFHGLYYTYFVIDMLIVLGAGELFFKDRRKEILKAIEHGVYLSRITLDQARNDSSWFDSKKSELRIGWHHHKQSGSLIAGDSIKEPGLVPLAVRCNVLYAYYVQGGSIKEIDGLFDLLCENRDETTGLWDNQGFDLMITERAVEALVDFADYLRKYPSQTKVILPAEKADAPAPTDIQSLFQACVRTAVKEVLESDGLIAGVLASQSNAEIVGSEDQSAKLLNSIVRSLGQVRASEDRAVAVLYSNFKRELRDIIDEVILDAIQGTKPNETVETKYQMNKEHLRNALKGFLMQDANFTTGDVFSYLNKKYVSDLRSGGKS
jgi:hypothetical protein